MGIGPLICSGNQVESSLGHEIRSVHSQIQDIDSKVENSAQHTQSELRDLDTKIEGLSSKQEVEQVKNQVESLVGHEIRSVHSQVQNLDSKVETNAVRTQSEFQDLDSKIQDLSSKQEVEQVKNQVQDLKSKVETKTIFSAEKTGGSNFAGKITYDRASVNIGGAMNAGSGEFQTKTAGLYYFSFSGASGYQVTSNTVVDIMKNGSRYSRIYDGNDSGRKEADENNMNYVWMMNLEVGDKVYLHVTHNKLYADANQWITFTGQLLTTNI